MGDNMWGYVIKKQDQHGKYHFYSSTDVYGIDFNIHLFKSRKEAECHIKMYYDQSRINYKVVGLSILGG